VSGRVYASQLTSPAWQIAKIKTIRAIVATRWNVVESVKSKNTYWTKNSITKQMGTRGLLDTSLHKVSLKPNELLSPHLYFGCWPLFYDEIFKTISVTDVKSTGTMGF
jgi:hypothetical protein